MADAPRPALEVGKRGVDPGEDFTGGPVADDLGPVAVPRHRAAAVCLDGRGRGGVAHSEVVEILGVAGRDRGQPQAARRVAVPSSTAPATGILPSGLRPGPEGAPLSRCGRLASSIPTRPDSGLLSGVAMARRSLAASIQALRQDPIPSRFCNCKAEMPLE